MMGEVDNLPNVLDVPIFGAGTRAKISRNTKIAMARPDVKARQKAGLANMTETAKKRMYARSAEWRAKVSRNTKIALANLDVRAKMSKNIKIGLANMTEIAKERMYANRLIKNKGRLCTIEARANMSKAMKISHARPEVRKKISKAVKIYLRENPEAAGKGFREYYAHETDKQRAERVKKGRKTEDTLIERITERWLMKQGIEYVKQKAIPLYKLHKPRSTRPDFFVEPNICIYVDGWYWHSKPSQITHDASVSSGLVEFGYVSIRISESSVCSGRFDIITAALFPNLKLLIREVVEKEAEALGDKDD